MQMLDYEFTKRDKGLLLILLVAVLGLIYYQVDYVMFQEEMASLDVAPLEMEAKIEEKRSFTKKQMLREIEKAQGRKESRIPVYNAQAEELRAMAEALSGRADNLSISWEEPVLKAPIVKRTATLSFACGSYKDLVIIVEALRDLKCRCLVRDLTLTSSEDALSVSLQVTFYETTEGAKDLSGLKAQTENAEQ